MAVLPGMDTVHLTKGAYQSADARNGRNWPPLMHLEQGRPIMEYGDRPADVLR